MSKDGLSTSRSSVGRNAPSCSRVDTLTIISDASEAGDAVQMNFINERELDVWPYSDLDDLLILFNGGSSEGRSWTFKHTSDIPG